MTRKTLGLLCLPVAMSVTTTSQQSGGASPRVVRLVAERFVFTPSEITVTEGTLVEFRIKSDDTAHGFRLVGSDDIDVEIPKRGRGDIRVMFDAKTAGTYIFECSRLCGAGHNFMRGSIRVVPKSPASE
jgi:cytochrome c oxidase subunit 2